MPIIEFVILLTNIGMILTILNLFIGAWIEESKIPQNERGNKNLERKDFLQQIIPSV